MLDNIRLPLEHGMLSREEQVARAQHYLELGVDGIHLADYGLGKKSGRSGVKSVQPLIEKIRAAVANDAKVRQKDV